MAFGGAQQQQPQQQSHWHPLECFQSRKQDFPDLSVKYASRFIVLSSFIPPVICPSAACCMFTKEMQKFTRFQIHCGMFDDHQSKKKKPKKSNCTKATRSDQIKLFDHLLSPSDHRRLFLFLGITQPPTSVTPSQTLCAA